MAEQIRKAYADLTNAYTYAHRLKKDEIISKLSTVLGTSKDGRVLPIVAATFLELCKMADFEGELPAELSSGEVVVSLIKPGERKHITQPSSDSNWQPQCRFNPGS